MQRHLLYLFTIFTFLPSSLSYSLENDTLPTRSFEIKMPNSKPTEPETYLCTPVRLDKQNTHYIVGFDPLADRKTAHHMLLYGCKTPGRQDPIFNCGAMTVKQEGLSSGN